MRDIEGREWEGGIEDILRQSGRSRERHKESREERETERGNEGDQDVDGMDRDLAARTAKRQRAVMGGGEPSQCALCPCMSGRTRRPRSCRWIG